MFGKSELIRRNWFRHCHPSHRAGCGIFSGCAGGQDTKLTARSELARLEHLHYDRIFVLADSRRGKGGADECSLACVTQLKAISGEEKARGQASPRVTAAVRGALSTSREPALATLYRRSNTGPRSGANVRGGGSLQMRLEDKPRQARTLTSIGAVDTTCRARAEAEVRSRWCSARPAPGLRYTVLWWHRCNRPMPVAFLGRFLRQTRMLGDHASDFGRVSRPSSTSQVELPPRRAQAMSVPKG